MEERKGRPQGEVCRTVPKAHREQGGRKSIDKGGEPRERGTAGKEKGCGRRKRTDPGGGARGPGRIRNYIANKYRDGRISRYTDIDINISTYKGINKNRQAALLPFLPVPGRNHMSQNVFSGERCLLPGV